MSNSFAATVTTCASTTSNLDQLLELEESFVDQGYQEGYEQGFDLGLKDGYTLGHDHGEALGMETGYYLAGAHYLLSQFSSSSQPRHMRACRLLPSLISILKTFPSTNEPNINMLQLLEECQLKWKCIYAMLGWPLTLTKFSLPTKDAPSSLYLSSASSSSSFPPHYSSSTSGTTQPALKANDSMSF